METNTNQNGNSETKKQYMKIKIIGWFNTRLDTIEEKISEPKDWAMKNFQTHAQKEKRMKRTEQNVRKIWDMVISYSICVNWSPRGEERENGAQEIFQYVFKLRSKKVINSLVQEPQATPNNKYKENYT